MRSSIRVSDFEFECIASSDRDPTHELPSMLHTCICSPCLCTTASRAAHGRVLLIRGTAWRHSVVQTGSWVTTGPPPLHASICDLRLTLTKNICGTIYDTFCFLPPNHAATLHDEHHTNYFASLWASPNAQTEHLFLSCQIIFHIFLFSGELQGVLVLISLNTSSETRVPPQQAHRLLLLLRCFLHHSLLSSSTDSWREICNANYLPAT